MTTNATINQRYTRLLEKAQRTVEMLNEVLEVDAEEYGSAEARIYMISSAITMYKEDPRVIYLNDLERSIKGGMRYVRLVRNIWRNRFLLRGGIGYEVGYYRNCRTGNYEVSWIDPSKSCLDRTRVKRAVFLPNVIHNIAPQTLADKVAGVVTVTYDQMVRLGFIVKQVSAA